MGSMAAAQGMFGGYGMNMNNMSNGMSMGFGAEQQMYSNWDNSRNNMYNPTAYSNGMGQNYGASGYAGYMSQHNGNNYSQMQQYPNQNYQNGYYQNGPGYMRGMGRGRGRGFYRGRGGYDGHMHANNYTQSQHQNNLSGQPIDDEIKRFNDELAPGGENDIADDVPKDSTTAAMASEDSKNPNLADPTQSTDKQLDSREDGEPAKPESPTSQLQGIPTIDSIDSAPSHPMGFSRGSMPAMDQGFGRGRGYNRGGFVHHRGGFYNSNVQGPPAGQGVVGAPIAPRAMRAGLPNTSNRGRLPGPGRTASIASTAQVVDHDLQRYASYT